MRTDPIKLCQVSPLDLAIQYYRANSSIDFFEVLADYMRNGIVVARPTCFFMCRLANVTTKKHGTQLAWFVEFGIGDLRELLTLFPAHLDWIAFYRRKKEKAHVWPLRGMMDLAYRKKETDVSKTM